MYTYQFIATIQGISIETDITFASISPLIRNTTIKRFTADEILIEVSKTRTYPETIALEEATLEAEELIDRLSLIQNHYVISFEYRGHIDNTGSFHKARTHGSFGAQMSLRYEEKHYHQESHKHILTCRLNPGLTRLHRTAQGMPNGIGKFLLLYGALQIMQGETQSKVDNFLLSERPDLLIVKGMRRDETILSHLRNLIAHPPQGLDIQSLNRQVEDYCSILSEIVKRELLRRLPP